MNFRSRCRPDSFENGPFFNEAEPPVIIDIYSDGSDTESFSELQDADELLNVWTSLVMEEDDNFRTPSPVFFVVESELNELRELHHDTSAIVNAYRSPTPTTNENKQVRRTKNSSMKSRRSGMGKKKARRFENGA